LIHIAIENGLLASARSAEEPAVDTATGPVEGGVFRGGTSCHAQCPFSHVLKAHMPSAFWQASAFCVAPSGEHASPTFPPDAGAGGGATLGGEAVLGDVVGGVAGVVAAAQAAPSVTRASVARRVCRRGGEAEHEDMRVF
jgi:hypothetical protein